MPSDKENVAFLYAIIKRLDMAKIDWKGIAVECNINNDHAARMRWHRFKQKAGDVVPGKRGPRKGPAKMLKDKQAQLADEEEDDIMSPDLGKKKRVKGDFESEDDLDIHPRQGKRINLASVKAQDITYPVMKTEASYGDVPGLESVFVRVKVEGEQQQALSATAHDGAILTDQEGVSNTWSDTLNIERGERIERAVEVDSNLTRGIVLNPQGNELVIDPMLLSESERDQPKEISQTHRVL